MDNFRQRKITNWFDYHFSWGSTGVENLIDRLNNICYPNGQYNFADVCVVVYNLKKEVPQDKEQDFNTIMRDFGLDKTQTSRLLSSYDKYIENDKIKPIFFPFSKSKLFEMLPIETKQLEDDIHHKVLRPDLTVQTIRKYVKSHIQKSYTAPEPVTIDESKIPAAYDPSYCYDFKYFETKSKNQLLNMIWQLQKYAHDKNPPV